MDEVRGWVVRAFCFLNWACKSLKIAFLSFLFNHRQLTFLFPWSVTVYDLYHCLFNWYVYKSIKKRKEKYRSVIWQNWREIYGAALRERANDAPVDSAWVSHGICANSWTYESHENEFFRWTCELGIAWHLPSIYI